MNDISNYIYVQTIAKETMKELLNFIKEGISEREIVDIAERIMKDKGIVKYWYHGVGAFVHIGKRTTISESGINYIPSDKLVERNDIVTIDLSPEFKSYWGDYARTCVVINGKAIGEDSISPQHNNAQFIEGVNFQKKLHKIFRDYVKPEMTFEDVYLYINEVIRQEKYKNLDFAGNVGHTIEFDKNIRRYFELGNKTKLNEVTFFTFEPHIKKENEEYGFKREDIYYFENDQLLIL
ncbi:M24 family metallopeptidase [Halalkalibacter urbisdiaboli]|uniref:M24 family metallopeptidase n=1 Tax=Halalkalibacter urbisdiaboli TaxID=1960589 RepID=UPI000B442FB9|nr:M24 family metallopeptidase [Halalkalibacter urbisdiaboli]